MGVEIERKFLVNREVFKSLETNDSYYIAQGYILNTPEKVVRIRVTEDKSYITVKGANIGASRPEFEYLVPKMDAEIMLKTMCEDIVVKTRHIFHIFGDVWEIDEFHGDNEGLIVAECEIPSEDYELRLPKWIIEEVTGQERFYNNSLANYPFSEWLDKLLVYEDL